MRTSTDTATALTPSVAAPSSTAARRSWLTSASISVNRAPYTNQRLPFTTAFSTDSAQALEVSDHTPRPSSPTPG